MIFSGDQVGSWIFGKVGGGGGGGQFCGNYLAKVKFFSKPIYDSFEK